MKKLAVAVIAAVLTLSGCADRYPDYNYKMTIHVGDNAYSTVRGIETEEVTSIVDSSGSTVKTRVTGEAVIMDLPSGRTVYGRLTDLGVAANDNSTFVHGRAA